ncbi:hypothetical protein [Kitasatospora cineracea]|uniref:Uncharacterized protein n=1 Tax=Kitasatospora cineracea TaxID=88074 RepID=A0A3N4R1P0_9ACTN|nr:hypothetical protein [Kitasatospora cineracea]RPE27248.1 hypothetical protein EDD38_7393 [Kitasatospora cineracea]
MTSTPEPAGPPQAFDVEALFDAAVEDIVRTADPQACAALVDTLVERGALWEGMLLMLGPTASRRVFGLGEEQAVKKLAALADTPDKVTALTYRLWEQFRSRGSAAARDVWDAAPAELHRGTALQLLVVYAAAIGADAGRLGPREVVRLTRALVPVTW